MPDFDPQCGASAPVYELETNAPGLMPWLIVRTHSFSPKFHWRRGVRLSHQEHAALIELDSNGHRLELSVYGPSPAYFFHLLMDVIQRVMERWPGLQYEGSSPVAARSAENNRVQASSSSAPWREHVCLAVMPIPAIAACKTAMSANS